MVNTFKGLLLTTRNGLDNDIETVYGLLKTDWFSPSTGKIVIPLFRSQCFSCRRFPIKKYQKALSIFRLSSANNTVNTNCKFSAINL